MSRRSFGMAVLMAALMSTACGSDGPTEVPSVHLEPSYSHGGLHKCKIPDNKTQLPKPCQS